MFPCTKNSRFIAISAQVKSENAQVNAQVNVKHVQVETQNNDVNLEEKLFSSVLKLKV